MKNYEVKYENMTNITAVLSKDDFRTFTEKVDIVEYDTVLDTYEVILLDNSKTMEELDRITS